MSKQEQIGIVFAVKEQFNLIQIEPFNGPGEHLAAPHRDGDVFFLFPCVFQSAVFNLIASFAGDNRL